MLNKLSRKEFLFFKFKLFIINIYIILAKVNVINLEFIDIKNIINNNIIKFIN